MCDKRQNSIGAGVACHVRWRTNKKQNIARRYTGGSALMTFRPRYVARVALAKQLLSPEREESSNVREGYPTHARTYSNTDKPVASTLVFSQPPPPPAGQCFTVVVKLA